MDFEAILMAVIVSFLMWILSAAIYVRASKRSTLLKQTVGI